MLYHGWLCIYVALLPCRKPKDEFQLQGRTPRGQRRQQQQGQGRDKRHRHQ